MTLVIFPNMIQDIHVVTPKKKLLTNMLLFSKIPGLKHCHQLRSLKHFLFGRLDTFQKLSYTTSGSIELNFAR